MAAPDATLAAAAARLSASHRLIVHSLRAQGQRGSHHPWLVVGAAATGVLLLSHGRWLKPALMAGVLTPAAGRWALRALLSAWLRRARLPP